jgi:hypothetical protein
MSSRSISNSAREKAFQALSHALTILNSSRQEEETFKTLSFKMRYQLLLWTFARSKVKKWRTVSLKDMLW